MNTSLKTLWFTSLIIAIGACESQTEKTCTSPPENLAYYSDYFVFVANDGDENLVIPLDVNWNPNTNGYQKTFKSWHGTSEEWPINYWVQDVTATPCDVPQESWEHVSDDNFQFNAVAREISSAIPNGPKVALSIPEEDKWIIMPSAPYGKSLYAFKTTAKVDGKSRTGWMIYERIRREADSKNTAVVNFKDFYWMPIVSDGNFYYFQDHAGVQSACRWVENEGKITADTLKSFTLNILATSADATSGRSAVVDKLQIIAQKWQVDFTLNSTGNQTGYGPEFPNGLALYRQSLLEPHASTVTNGYGMLELILEDD